jgi:hypothetical protein
MICFFKYYKYFDTTCFSIIDIYAPHFVFRQSYEHSFDASRK